jgi:hypothetical protein
MERIGHVHLKVSHFERPSASTARVEIYGASARERSQWPVTAPLDVSNLAG